MSKGKGGLKEANSTSFRAGKLHPNWKGGKFKDHNGYIKILVSKCKYRLEHILIMEKHIGRKLIKGEVIHHINSIRNDNKIENLRLMTNSEHSQLHATGVKQSKEHIEKSRKARIGLLAKEKHPLWKKWVTKEIILDARKKFNSKRAIANFLNIHIDSLRYREKYYKIFHKHSYTRKQIIQALKTNNNFAQAAKKVNIDPKTLKYAMINFGIFYNNISKVNLWAI